MERGWMAAAFRVLNVAVTSFMQRAHGVVVSHPLRMRKALGSNPSVSTFHFTGCCKPLRHHAACEDGTHDPRSAHFSFHRVLQIFKIPCGQCGSK